MRTETEREYPFEANCRPWDRSSVTCDRGGDPSTSVVITATISFKKSWLVRAWCFYDEWLAGKLLLENGLRNSGWISIHRFYLDRGKINHAWFNLISQTIHSQTNTRTISNLPFYFIIKQKKIEPTNKNSNRSFDFQANRSIVQASQSSEKNTDSRRNYSISYFLVKERHEPTPKIPVPLITQLRYA